MEIGITKVFAGGQVVSASMTEPLSAIFSGINTAFKLAEFLLSLKEASKEVQVFARLITRVRKDREEALRERYEKATILQSYPHKKRYLDEAIKDVDESLLVISRLVEGARVDGERGQAVSLKHRFQWVLSHKEEFMTKQTYLSTCHLSLLHALGAIQGLKGPDDDGATSNIAPPPSYEAPVNGDELSDFVLRPPSLRRPKSKPEYVIPNVRSDSQSFADDWRSRFNGSPSVIVEDEVAWDDVDSKQLLGAASDAIRELGGASRSTNEIAASLGRSGTQERRRRMESRFGITSDEP